MPGEVPSYDVLKPMLDAFHNSIDFVPTNDQSNNQTNKKSPSFKTEESRLLKAHITGVLTKYVNILKVNDEDKGAPYMYDYTQGVIGVSTIILYYCAAPFICKIILDDISTNIVACSALLDDPFFSNYWKYGRLKTHKLNDFASTAASPKPNSPNSPNTVEKNAYSVQPESHYPVHMFTGIASFEELHSKLVAANPLRHSSNGIRNTAVITNFLNRMKYISDIFWQNDFNEIPPDVFMQCIEDLRTVYIFYFKGGNSIRQIVESFNKRVHDTIKINDIDKTIPYGSDFDTNILINPYLPLKTFNKIQHVIEAFIPQISQYIKLPSQLKGKLTIDVKEELMREMLTNKNPDDRNEQELQMHIALNVYEKLNKHYVTSTYVKDGQTIVTTKIEDMERRLRTLKGKPIISISPDITYIGNNPSKRTTVVLSCDSPNMPELCSNTISSVSYEHYPYPYGKMLGPLNKYISDPKNESCFGCLQYSINKTIAKFRLHRFFLKFQFGPLVQLSNGKHRLISETGFFNAEMFDISIVQPYYMLNNSKDAYTCELLELWSNASDIYKIMVNDKYKVLKDLYKNVPGITRHMDDPRYTAVPLFVNGIDIQIEDIATAISDTIVQGNVEKLPKRIKRLRLLNYLKVLSPQYTSNPITDILMFDTLISLNITVPNEFYHIFTMFTKEDDDAIKYLHRSIWEYHQSQINNKFLKSLEQLIPEIKYGGGKGKLSGLITQLMIASISRITKPVGPYNYKDFALEVMLIIHSNVLTEIRKILQFAIGAPDQAGGLTFIPRSDGMTDTYVIQYNPNIFGEMVAYAMNDPENDYRISALFADLFLTHIEGLYATGGNHLSSLLSRVPDGIIIFFNKLKPMIVRDESSKSTNLDMTSNMSSKVDVHATHVDTPVTYETSVVYMPPSQEHFVMRICENIMIFYCTLNACLTSIFIALNTSGITGALRFIDIDSTIRYNPRFYINPELIQAAEALFGYLELVPNSGLERIATTPYIQSMLVYVRGLKQYYDHVVSISGIKSTLNKDIFYTHFFSTFYFTNFHRALTENKIPLALQFSADMIFQVHEYIWPQPANMLCYLTSVTIYNRLIYSTPTQKLRLEIDPEHQMHAAVPVLSSTPDGFKHGYTRMQIITPLFTYIANPYIPYGIMQAVPISVLPPSTVPIFDPNNPIPLFPPSRNNAWTYHPLPVAGGRRNKSRKRTATRRKLKTKSRNPKRHTRNVKKRMYK